MTDLVSRLLEAIAETERLAEAAGRDGEPNWTAGGDLSETVSTVKYGQPVAAGPYGYLVPEIRAHIAHNDPASVLRRCAADRELVELYRDSTKMYTTRTPRTSCSRWSKCWLGRTGFPRSTMTEICWVGPPMDFGSGDVASVDAELAGLRHMGLSIGLTLADVEDTISAWTDWWGVGPATHLDFGIISRSLARRGLGQSWRPEEGDG